MHLELFDAEGQAVQVTLFADGRDDIPQLKAGEAVRDNHVPSARSAPNNWRVSAVREMSVKALRNRRLALIGSIRSFVQQIKIQDSRERDSILA